MSVKPGITVQINLNPSSENARSLKAVIYDVVEGRLVLSQTSPPIPPSRLGRRVHVSFITGRGSSARRLGFSALISGFDDDYELSTGMRAPALIVEMIHDPEETSLRQGFRIRTPNRSGLALAIHGRNYLIFDISLTGVNFIQPSLEPPFKPSATLECRLNIDGTSYLLNARVIRVVDTAALRHVGAIFVAPGKDLQPVLSRKILQLEREELSRHSGTGRSLRPKP
ncbi:MAG: hypothetical protein ACYDAA_02625 [Syntrophales bacterium]